MSAAAECIGPCEFCGATDHHLVDGICPTCRPKCMAISVSGSPRLIARARQTFLQLGECARLALANLDMPDDENAGDEAGVRREVVR
jgi:hypothetical protein